jgi:hypothetical protein
LVIYAFSHFKTVSAWFGCKGTFVCNELGRLLGESIVIPGIGLSGIEVSVNLSDDDNGNNNEASLDGCSGSKLVVSVVELFKITGC